jgi:cytidylate kinase
LNRHINIAIDGHSSTGKSTLAKALARELGFRYIDSGAMYRAVTLYALQNGLLKDGLNEDGLIRELDNIAIDFQNKDGQNQTLLNGKVVESEIRGMDVSNSVSLVSKVSAVRKKLRELQQEMAEAGGVVMDGRDIGSAVLPQAELKIFMTADPEIRAQRRFEELKAKGQSVSLEDVQKNISERDHLDSSRKENPLIKVDEAKELDNSHLSQQEQVNIALNWAREIIESRQ